MKMRKLLPASLIAIGLLSGAAFAKDKGHDNGHNKPSGFREHSKHQDRDLARNHGRKDGDRHYHRTSASSRPPGWDKGKKTGWGNCDVPPGQAKKSGCNNGGTVHHTTRNRRHDRVVTHHPRRPMPTNTVATATRPVNNPNNNRDNDSRPMRNPR